MDAEELVYAQMEAQSGVKVPESTKIINREATRFKTLKEGEVGEQVSEEYSFELMQGERLSFKMTLTANQPLYVWVQAYYEKDEVFMPVN